MGVRSNVTVLLKKTINSLDAKEGKGFSTKKIAFAVIITCVIFIHASWLKHAFLKEDYKYILEILVIDYLFALLIKGVVTFKEVIALKNGNKVNEEKSKEDEDKQVCQS